MNKVNPHTRSGLLKGLDGRKRRFSVGKQWQSRFCSLSDNTLTVHAGQAKDSEILQLLSLQEWVISSEKAHHDRALSLKRAEEVIQLYASSTSLRDEWLVAMQNSQVWMALRTATTKKIADGGVNTVSPQNIGVGNLERRVDSRADRTENGPEPAARDSSQSSEREKTADNRSVSFLESNEALDHVSADKSMLRTPATSSKAEQKASGSGNTTEALATPRRGSRRSSSVRVTVAGAIEGRVDIYVGNDIEVHYGSTFQWSNQEIRILDHFLWYTAPDQSEGERAVALDGAYCCRVNLLQKPHCYCVRTEEAEVFLAWSSASDMRTWVEAIESVSGAGSRIDEKEIGIGRRFSNILVDSSDELASSLGSVVAASEASQFAIYLSRAIISSEISHNGYLRVVCGVAEDDIRRTLSASTLFRQNSLATMLLAECMRLYGGSTLVELLETQVGAVTEGMSMEVDPKRVAATADISKNVQRVQEATSAILEQVAANVDSMPFPLRRVAASVRAMADKQFKGSGRVVVGGMIFLRFICPALIAPEKSGFSDIPPTLVGRRNLVLVTKVLQTIANFVDFGQKEPYMQPFNDYVREKYKVMEAFCDAVSADLDVEIRSDHLFRPLVDSAISCVSLLRMLANMKLAELGPVLRSRIENLIVMLPRKQTPCEELLRVLPPPKADIVSKFQRNAGLKKGSFKLFGVYRCQLDRRMTVLGSLYISDVCVFFHGRLFGMKVIEYLPAGAFSVTDGDLPGSLVLNGDSGKRLCVHGFAYAEEIRLLLSGIEKSSSRASPNILKKRSSLSVVTNTPDDSASSGMRESDWLLLLEGARELVFAKDQPIVIEGEETLGMYQIGAGTVRVQGGSDPNVRVFARMSEGQLFGEISFLQGGKRSASVVADSPSGVLVYGFEGKAAESVLEQNTDTALRFYKYLALVIAERLAHANQRAAEANRSLQAFQGEARLSREIAAASARNENNDLAEGNQSQILELKKQIQELQQAAKDQNSKFERDTESFRESAECAKVELDAANSQLEERMQQLNLLRRRVIDFSERWRPEGWVAGRKSEAKRARSASTIEWEMEYEEAELKDTRLSNLDTQLDTAFECLQHVLQHRDTVKGAETECVDASDANVDALKVEMSELKAELARLSARSHDLEEELTDTKARAASAGRALEAAHKTKPSLIAALADAHEKLRSLGVDISSIDTASMSKTKAGLLCISPFTVQAAIAPGIEQSDTRDYGDGDSSDGICSPTMVPVNTAEAVASGIPDGDSLNAQLREELSSLRAKLAAVEEEKTQLEQRQDVSTVSSDFREKALIAVRNDASELSRQLAVLQKENAEQQKEIGLQMDRNSTLFAENESLQAENEKQRSRLTSTHIECELLSNQVTTLNKDLVAERLAHAQLVEELSQLQNDTRLEFTGKEARELEGSLDLLQVQCRSLLSSFERVGRP